MKSILLLMTLTLGLNTSAATYRFQGPYARKMIETLAAAGFIVSGLQADWSTTPLSVTTGPFYCHYSVARYPDNWLSGANCFLGEAGSTIPLKNPLALINVIQKVAYVESGVGNRYLTMKQAVCSFVYPSTQYECVLEADGN